MAKMQTTLAFIAVAAALTASAPAAAQGRKSYNPSLYSVNQPVVQRNDYVLDLASTGNNVPEPELHRLADWFETLQLGYGDRVSIDTGSYSSPGAREDIARVAAEFGLLLSRGVPVTAGAVQPGSIRVIVSRSEAWVPGCPNWSEAGEIGTRVSTGSNYGCATNSNLAAMVADPKDLVLGQTGSGSGDAAEATRSVRVYRNRVPTGASGQLKSESAGGKQ